MLLLRRTGDIQREGLNDFKRTLSRGTIAGLMNSGVIKHVQHVLGLSEIGVDVNLKTK